MDPKGKITAKQISDLGAKAWLTFVRVWIGEADAAKIQAELSDPRSQFSQILAEKWDGQLSIDLPMLESCSWRQFRLVMETEPAGDSGYMQTRVVTSLFYVTMQSPDGLAEHLCRRHEIDAHGEMPFQKTFGWIRHSGVDYDVAVFHAFAKDLIKAFLPS